MVVFDLPETKSAMRTRLRRFLRDHGFGYLQNSVWITPDPLGPLMASWMAKGTDVEALITFVARPCSGESDAAVVAGAWDFKRINAAYAKCRDILEEFSTLPPISRSTAEAWHRWAKAEREAWLESVSEDPLLPRRLLPDGYLGETVWKQRQQLLGAATRRIGE